MLFPAFFVSEPARVSPQPLNKNPKKKIGYNTITWVMRKPRYS